MDDCGRRMLSFEVPLHKIATCVASNTKETAHKYSLINQVGYLTYLHVSIG